MQLQNPTCPLSGRKVRQKEEERREKNNANYYGHYVYACSQGQRTHSARTNSLYVMNSLGQKPKYNFYNFCKAFWKIFQHTGRVYCVHKQNVKPLVDQNAHYILLVKPQNHCYKTNFVNWKSGKIWENVKIIAFHAKYISITV